MSSLSAAGSSITAGSSIAASSLLTGYPILPAQALRYGLAACLLFLVARGKPRWPGRVEVVQIVALAAMGLVGFNIFLIRALREADAGTVGVIVGCVPVVLAIAGPLIHRRAPSRMVLGAALIVAIGAAIVQWSGGRSSLLGLLFAGGALMCESAVSLLAVPLISKFGPLEVAIHACLVAALLLAFGSLAFGAEHTFVLPDSMELGAILYLAVMVTALAFVLWCFSLQHLDVERVGLFAGLVPVSALLTAAAIGATTASLSRVLGAALIGVGVSVGMRRNTHKSK